nr:dorsal-ventral patterning protein tolloid-like [Crassostrea gigas]
MLLRPVWIVAAFNIVIVSNFMTSDLACSGGSAEIEIDGYDPRGFRFPPKGSYGFPVTTTCVWKFITEADLRIVLGVTDITKDATDTITLRDSNGDILPTTSVAVGTREGFEIVTSTGNSISVQLDTNDSSNDEEIYIYVISGVDSGTCPGTSTISATDEYQIVTSSNFPDNYNGDEVCTVSITADENKVISYEILFKQIEDSTTFDECSEIFEVFDGSTLENRIFDTCNPFLPGRLSKLKTTSVGRTLDLRFVSDSSIEKHGFVLLFKQEDINECLEKNCSPREICFEPESLNEYECNGHATTTEKRFLSCPNDGSEVVIDVPEFEAQTFSFPPPETDGFPISSTCTWTFKGEEGSGIIIHVFNMTFERFDSLSVDNEEEIFGRRTTFSGPITQYSDDQSRISIDNSMKVILTTNNNFNKMKRFTVSVISGRDSETCPGSKTIQATDSFQTITSANFPEPYLSDGDCDVTITADEGMVIVFSFPVLIVDDYQDACFDYLTLSTGTSIKSFLDDLVLRKLIFRFINFYEMQ